MAIETTIPLRVELEITGYQPVTDIYQNVLEGSQNVHFNVKQIDGLALKASASGYFELSDSYEMFESGTYRVIGHFGYASSLPSRFGLICITFGDMTFDVSNS